MRRSSVLALLLVSCSAGEWADDNVMCLAHPSRWDNGCHVCNWTWTIARQDTYRCVDPETVTGTCGGSDCSQRDPVELTCAEGVQLRFYVSDGYVTIIQGRCSESIPATFTFTRY